MVSVPLLKFGGYEFVVLCKEGRDLLMIFDKLVEAWVGKPCCLEVKHTRQGNGSLANKVDEHQLEWSEWSLGSISTIA